MLDKGIKALTNLFLPALNRCQLCGRRRCEQGRHLCAVCAKELEYWKEKYFECGTCGRYIPAAGICPRCSEAPPPFALATAVGPYRGILKDSLHDLKYRGARWKAAPLGRLLAEKIKRRLPVVDVDLVLPVPMYLDRLTARGFNQAALLSEEVAREVNKPLKEDLLQKHTDTPSQIHLTREERETNLLQAFSADSGDSLKGKVVLLVDDILTTGSTASECSRVLLEAGAGKVLVATVATGIYLGTAE